MRWLGPVERRRGVPACEVRPDTQEGWRETIDAWVALPPHPSVLMPVDRDGDRLWVRYADVRFPAGDRQDRIATWLLALCDVYLHAEKAGGIARLARPALAIDRGHGLRVGFLPADVDDYDWLAPSAPIAEIAPFAIGSIADETWSGLAPDLATVVDAARGPRRERPDSVLLLEVMLKNTMLTRAARSEREHAAWLDYDRGLGFTKLGDVANAAKWFRSALDLDPAFELAQQAMGGVTAPPRTIAERTWVEIEPELLALEATDVEQARDRYHQAARVHPQARLGVARCQLALGAFTDAIEQAARAAAVRGAVRAGGRARTARRARHGARARRRAARARQRRRRRPLPARQGAVRARPAGGRARRVRARVRAAPDARRGDAPAPRGRPRDDGGPARRWREWLDPARGRAARRGDVDDRERLARRRARRARRQARARGAAPARALPGIPGKTCGRAGDLRRADRSRVARRRGARAARARALRARRSLRSTSRSPSGRPTSTPSTAARAVSTSSAAATTPSARTSAPSRSRWGAASDG